MQNEQWIDFIGLASAALTKARLTGQTVTLSGTWIVDGAPVSLAVQAMPNGFAVTPTENQDPDPEPPCGCV